MTSSQLVLVSVTSALIAVFAMLLVASLKRARSEEREEAEPGVAGGPRPASAEPTSSTAPAPDMPPVISGDEPTAAREEMTEGTPQRSGADEEGAADKEPGEPGKE